MGEKLRGGRGGRGFTTRITNNVPIDIKGHHTDEVDASFEVSDHIRVSLNELIS